MIFTVGILTISDKGFAGIRDDQSGLLLHRLIETVPGKVTCYEIVPDEKNKIRERLIAFCDQSRVNLLLTTGGTGPAPRDVTPEATETVIERNLPGIAEMLRMKGYQKNPRSILSRGISGIRGGTLIINLPGSPKACQEGMELLLPILPHALQKILGDQQDCGG